MTYKLPHWSKAQKIQALDQRAELTRKLGESEQKLAARFMRWMGLSQSPDLPLPHGLAPSETMVWDHGLNPPLSTENPRNKWYSGSGAPIFWFGLADPAPKG